MQSDCGLGLVPSFWFMVMFYSVSMVGSPVKIEFWSVVCCTILVMAVQSNLCFMSQINCCLMTICIIVFLNLVVRCTVRCLIYVNRGIEFLFGSYIVRSMWLGFWSKTFVDAKPVLKLIWSPITHEIALALVFSQSSIYHCAKMKFLVEGSQVCWCCSILI